MMVLNEQYTILGSSVRADETTPLDELSLILAGAASQPYFFLPVEMGDMKLVISYSPLATRLQT